MNYTVLVKDLATENVRVGFVTDDLAMAEAWMEIQLIVWEETKAYKIVEGEVE